MASGQTDRVAVNVRIDPEYQKRLEEIAYRRSEPGDYETVTSVVREAVEEYIEKHE